MLFDHPFPGCTVLSIAAATAACITLQIKMNLPIEINTVPQLIRHTVAEIHPESNTFMKYKAGDDWSEISYKEALAKIDAISAWFLSAGIQKGDRLALIIENGPDYIYYDQALQQIGAVSTSVYPTLSEAEVEYILKDSGAKMILIGNPFLLRKVAKIADNCPDLSYIIPAFYDPDKHLIKMTLNAKVICLHNLIMAGTLLVEQYAAAIHLARMAVIPEDLSCLIYTSGTTGIPKGVMLTHHNLCENVRVCLIQIPVIGSDDLFLSFLPLSHVFESTATYHICLAAGCQIAFAESLELLAKNMAEVKPTVMNCVPRLLERIHDKAIKGGTEAGGLKARLFLWALKTGKRYREATEAGIKPRPELRFKFRIADALVFSKIKAKTGGKLKFMISGGGALPKNIGEFFGNLGIKGTTISES